MNKVLFIIRIILFHLIAVLFFFVTRITDFVGWEEFMFVVIMILYEVLLVKDIIQKRNINNNKQNILSIISFMIIIFILSRCLVDSHFIYHNVSFLKKLNEYETMLYGSSRNIIQFSEIIGYYLMNNSLYFNIIFVLLFIYRKLNINIKNN